ERPRREGAPAVAPGGSHLGRRGRRAPRAPLGRGPALDRVIVDTSVWVRAERLGLAIDDVIRNEDYTAIAAVTAAELLEGVEHADDDRRAARSAWVERI